LLLFVTGCRGQGAGLRQGARAGSGVRGFPSVALHPAPCTPHPEIQGKRARMDEILALNELIRNHCRGKRVRLVDAYVEFADARDHLRKEFSAGDGGHLNGEGYRHMGRFMATSLSDILKPGAKVACLGDSITEGYPGHFNGQEETRQWEPYTHYLKRPGVKVTNFGLSGDTTEGMTRRFYRDVLRAGPTICIIMGGVNDLFGGIPPKEVLEALSALYADSERHQMLPVAVTVLPID